jgi:hypothetical protein
MPEEQETADVDVIQEDLVTTLKHITMTQNQHTFTFTEGGTVTIPTRVAKDVLKLCETLNDENRERLIEMASSNEEGFNKVVDFTRKNLK